jgi:hypothetical protein
MSYTLRRSWPDQPDRSDDYEFTFEGKAVGRCYLGRMARNEMLWHWTIYGTHLSGNEVSLDEAKAAFKRAFERADV